MGPKRSTDHLPLTLTSGAETHLVCEEGLWAVGDLTVASRHKIIRSLAIKACTPQLTTYDIVSIRIPLQRDFLF